MEVRKIAVLRANAVGDYLFAVPALEALRAAYPAAEIVLLGRRWHESFLAHRPGPVDRVAVVPNVEGINSDPPETNEGSPEEFFEAMSKERFDLALQMHGGGRHSNPFVSRLGAGLTAGLKTPDAAPLDRWVPYIYFQPEILRYLEVVSLVGVRPVVLEPRVAITESDLEESYGVVPDPGRPLIVLNPGAGDGRRRWPAEKFAQVGDALAGRGEIIIHGAGRDAPAVDSVCDLMKTERLKVCGNLSLGGLLGLLSRSRLLISNDSGPLHLAAAVSTPAVGIYWCGNLINAGPVTRTLHRPLISWRLDCPVCGRDTIYDNCEHHDSFVADISVEEVLQTAHDLLSFCRPQPKV